MSTAASFAAISDKLGKLIPRLGSNYSGEVVTTVAAIGRTLAGAGFDWHDLARRAATPSIMDMLGEPEPKTCPSRSEPREPPKPKREPSPWSTWSTLSHSDRLEMMNAMQEHAAFTKAEEAAFASMHEIYRRQHIFPDRKGTNLFNRASRNLWERGWRLERRDA